MRTTPTTIRQAGLAPGTAQWVISQGPTPTNVPGAATKNAAEPSAALDVRTPSVFAYGQSISWVSRTLLPDGSRNPESMPYGIRCGSSVKSTPRAWSSS